MMREVNQTIVRFEEVEFEDLQIDNLEVVDIGDALKQPETGASSVISSCNSTSCCGSSSCC